MSNKRIITASVIGNAMEWYDYLLYAHFSLIISELFFPLENSFYSQMLTLAVFAGGFLARPIGGYVFGIIGDRLGRKTALTTSILLMAIPTALIGVLPTYSQIGLLAPFVMVIIRILQGISLGGEYSSSTTYLFESAPRGKRGFFSSFSSMSLALGVLVSALTVLIIESSFTKEEIVDFAWRIPFLISILYGFVGFYIRSKLSETTGFKKAHKNKKPFATIFKYYKKRLFFAIGVFMGLTIPFYVIVVFSKTIMVWIGFGTKMATFLNCLLIFIYMIVVPFAGILVDKIGDRKMLMIGSLGMLLFSMPFIYALKSSNLSSVIFAIVIAGVFIGIYQSAVPAFSARAFPVSIRASGVSLSYNLPAILFGGTAPMIVTYIVNATGGSFTQVGFYLAFGCFFAFISSFFSKVNIDEALNQVEEFTEEVILELNVKPNNKSLKSKT
jgi:MHS family proline/betaine transporter-like MFS transporter